MMKCDGYFVIAGKL